jgi:hypothetical protein
MKQGKTFFFKDPIPGSARLYVLAVIALGLVVALYCLSRIAAEAGMVKKLSRPGSLCC